MPKNNYTQNLAYYCLYDMLAKDCDNRNRYKIENVTSKKLYLFTPHFSPEIRVNGCKTWTFSVRSVLELL